MSFSAVAAAYDILSDPEKRIAQEGAFLKQLTPPDARVLDLACATGVHGEFLARWGASVTACDLSPEMIACARQIRSHANLVYYERDMCDPPQGSFDLVLCIGNSINLLAERQTVSGMLESVVPVIAEEGVLLLHGLNPESKAHSEPTLTVKHGETEGRSLTVVKSMVPRAGDRLVSVSYYIDGEEPVATASRLLDLTREDVSTMLDDAGLSVQKWYGGFNGTDFVAGGSPDWVVVAKRQPIPER